MNNDTWDLLEFEILIDGQFYSVNADFAWEKDIVSVDYRAGRQWEMAALVPRAILKIEIYGPLENGETVRLSMLDTIKRAVLASFADMEESVRPLGWTRF